MFGAFVQGRGLLARGPFGVGQLPLGDQSVRGPNSRWGPTPVGDQSVRGQLPLGDQSVRGPTPVGDQSVRGPTPVGGPVRRGKTRKSADMRILGGNSL